MEAVKVPTAASRQSRHWRNEAARLIAVEVEPVLRRHNVPMARETLDFVGRLAGQVLAAVMCLPSEQRIAFDCRSEILTDAVSRLVLSLAMELEELQKQPQVSGKAFANQAIAQTSEASGPQDRYTLIQSWAGKVVGQTYLENELRIPRSTLHLWKRRNEVIALPKSRRTHVFPLAQFVDGRPVDGISHVLAEIENPRSAWLWLVRQSDLLDDKIPLDLLKQNRILQVADAAALHVKSGA
ncbi:hypothetical protein [Mesorhizobium sp. B4-1-4]|uniref:antitoxin Xre/MbcA/ParS-like domain-containing protein n=1 Tax=Mesorhizobium sp. B4-1-4 TaxID=2589888 RepID=UPI00112D8F0A|nr:hypothetical protein [Mesorhizobium sp. B4-1-4]UCI31770.1 hypothetical protein FJW03_29115 [Mesorhizobium sp. B4-1-4]